MAPELTRLVRRFTFALLVLAAAATEVAAVDSRSVLTSTAMAVFWVGLAALMGWLVPLPPDGRRTPPRFVFVILLALAAAPFAVEPLRRGWTGEGYPLELQMVFALRNLGLGLAAFSVWLLCLRLACVVSLFLMLFAVTMTDHRAVMILLGLYGATGSVWLMLVYWTGLRRFFVAADTAVTLEVQAARERFPWLAVFLMVGLLGCVVGLIAVGPRRAARVLGEWLPTSGGTSGYDPFARGGVNDGDDEVQGDNARSTGMTPTDSFLDSPLPSLYDILNDMYGEPFKTKDRERAIALDSRTKANESNKPPADNLRPNREFATTRKSPRRPRDPSDRAARAIFEIEGRTPLHIRVTAFDTFDGLAWHEAPLSGNPCPLEKEPNSCWMKVPKRLQPAIFAETESHQFKITSSLGTLVPAPPHLSRFRVGRVNDASFFGWGQDRILRMAQRKTPAGIVIETECRTVDPRLLDAIYLPSRYLPGGSANVELPESLDPEIAALARRWAGEYPKGWPQIAAIVQHLRSEYTLDPTARVPEDCRDPLGHFLLHSRRGPDYQFAGAAAVLARVLGYQTRLVSGFYASPDHYDPPTGHTPVVAEDLHFWTEVRLPSGDWLVVEPTPGYEVLGPKLPWSERALAALRALRGWLWEHLVAVSVCLVGLALLWRTRLDLFDASAAVFVRHFPGPSWQRCVRRVLWLLERRGRWAGRSRPTSQTPSTWLCRVLPASEQQSDLKLLTQMAEWCAYAPELAPPWSTPEVRRVCRRVLDTWSLQRWRALGNAHRVQGEYS
jgi:protein-glutamine gamma-glutamyltransferase